MNIYSSGDSDSGYDTSGSDSGDDSSYGSGYTDSGDTSYATETYDDSGYYSTLSDIEASFSAIASSADAAISSDEIYPTLGGGYLTPTASYDDYYSTNSGYSYLSAAYTSGSAAFSSAFASATGAAVCPRNWNHDKPTDVLVGQLK